MLWANVQCLLSGASDSRRTSAEVSREETSHHPTSWPPIRRYPTTSSRQELSNLAKPMWNYTTPARQGGVFWCVCADGANTADIWQFHSVLQVWNTTLWNITPRLQKGTLQLFIVQGFNMKLRGTKRHISPHCSHKHSEMQFKKA